VANPTLLSFQPASPQQHRSESNYHDQDLLLLLLEPMQQLLLLFVPRVRTAAAKGRPEEAPLRTKPLPTTKDCPRKEDESEKLCGFLSRSAAQLKLPEREETPRESQGDGGRSPPASTNYSTVLYCTVLYCRSSGEPPLPVNRTAPRPKGQSGGSCWLLRQVDGVLHRYHLRLLSVRLAAKA
jgi:hypothetical protein